MKRRLIYIALVLATGFCSCDYVSNPVEPVVDPNNNNGESCPDAKFKDNPTPYRTVLVEDYTAHKCTACPQAAIVATNLEKNYGEKVVVVAIHSGYFAEPDKKDYREEFRTEATKAYDLQFVPDTWPSGPVNRTDYGNPATFFKSYSSWSTEVSKTLQAAPDAFIQMDSEYSTTDSMVCVQVWSKFLNMGLNSADYKLCIMLTQDSIIAPQLNAGVLIKEYVHNHVLRDNINGTWGDSLLSGSVIPTPIIKKYRFKLKHDYNGLVCKPKNCHLVAFIYEKATFRVLQSAKIEVVK